jgi:hypothetical protein
MAKSKKRKNTSNKDEKLEQHTKVLEQFKTPKNDTPENLYDAIENLVQSKICPHYKIFHEGVSQKGNAWGKFFSNCSSESSVCTTCNYVLIRR